ncbi:hypothetical protein ABVT39_022985 [Epinephelus coioides]
MQDCGAAIRVKQRDYPRTSMDFFCDPKTDCRLRREKKGCSLTFLDRFLGLFSEVERDPEEAEFVGTGLVSAFTFTVCLTAALRLSAATNKSDIMGTGRLPV